MKHTTAATITPSTPGEVLEQPFIRVVFQSGFPNQVGVNGCRVEDVIQIAVKKLRHYQSGDLACIENEEALQHLLAATKALEDRIHRRQEQGVWNTMSRHETIRTEDQDHDFSATGA